MIDTVTKYHPNGQTVASIFKTQSYGLYSVKVIHKFDSGNFLEENHDNLSLVAAKGLLIFYTS